MKILLRLCTIISGIAQCTLDVGNHTIFRFKNFFPSLLAPLLHLTCGAGAVDGKDLVVSSDQGNA